VSGSERRLGYPEYVVAYYAGVAQRYMEDGAGRGPGLGYGVTPSQFGGESYSAGLVDMSGGLLGRMMRRLRVGRVLLRLLLLREMLGL
jgi:hypothetical protein